MTDQIASDHPSVETFRATVKRHGPGRRLALPEVAREALGVPGAVGTIVDGRTHFARCRAVGGTPSIVGLYATRTGADDRTGQDELGAWLDRHDRGRGRSVHVDVIEPGYRIGLRPPGERVVYEDVPDRDDGLDAIARDLLEG